MRLLGYQIWGDVWVSIRKDHLEGIHYERLTTTKSPTQRPRTNEEREPLRELVLFVPEGVVEGYCLAEHRFTDTCHYNIKFRISKRWREEEG